MNYSLFDETICAPATIPGTGAISVIRVSGPETIAIADRIVRCAKGSIAAAEGYSIKFGHIYESGDEGVGGAGDAVGAGGAKLIDEVLVSVFRAPHSYTGEDSVEISCHSSSYIVSAILGRLCEEGCRLAGPGEFTRRAFVAGKMDLAQAEAVADLIAANSRAAHNIAINQLRGHYSDELKALRDEILHLTALMELELDFSEEDVEFADRARLAELLEKASSHVSRLADSFQTGNAVKNGVPVAIVGAPNSGKSTLLNALLGEEKAIVSDIPGTTRDSIEDTCVIDGILFRFIDTAGIRDSSDVIERMGIERSLDKITFADVVIELVDASDPADISDKISKRLGSGSKQKILLRVSNKTDIAPALEGTIGISAMDYSGIDELRKTIAKTQIDRFENAGTLVTNVRHYEALSLALKALRRSRKALGDGLTSDLVAEDLRDAVRHLNEIFGPARPASGAADASALSASDPASAGSLATQIDFRAVTDLIFSRFCIGK